MAKIKQFEAKIKQFEAKIKQFEAFTKMFVAYKKNWVNLSVIPTSQLPVLSVRTRLR